MSGIKTLFHGDESLYQERVRAEVAETDTTVLRERANHYRASQEYTIIFRVPLQIVELLAGTAVSPIEYHHILEELLEKRNHHLNHDGFVFPAVAVR
ncbi:hypothetical protein HYZ97_02575 [Candidatus Pacearchaeota archaeon]|nr:hypothetical protein [Candidatus Pacearchaeota archaeon]